MGPLTLCLKRNKNLHMCLEWLLELCLFSAQSVKVGLRDTFSCTYYAEDCSTYAAEEYDSDGAEADLNLHPEAIILKPSQPITAGAIQALPALARDTDFTDSASLNFH
jgi:hypothetical protein